MQLVTGFQTSNVDAGLYDDFGALGSDVLDEKFDYVGQVEGEVVQVLDENIILINMTPSSEDIHDVGAYTATIVGFVLCLTRSYRIRWVEWAWYSIEKNELKDLETVFFTKVSTDGR